MESRETCDSVLELQCSTLSAHPVDGTGDFHEHRKDLFIDENQYHWHLLFNMNSPTSDLQVNLK